MDDGRPSDWRSSLFDTDDRRRLVNEFLLAVFLPGALAFVALWAAFRLYLDEFLRSIGLVAMTPDPLPFVAVESGYGRFVLLVVLSALVVLVYLGVYVRVIRGRLKARGIV